MKYQISTTEFNQTETWIRGLQLSLELYVLVRLDLLEGAFYGLVNG